MKRSGTVQPPAPPRQQPRPHTRQAPPHPQERGASPTTYRAPAAPPPPPNHSRRRETQAADPHKAARRRAPPLAAGTPENPIARAGGRVSRGAGSHRISAHRGGEPPAPPLVDLRHPQMPRTALYLVFRFFGHPPHMDAAKKGSGAEAPPPRFHPSHGYQISPRSA